VIDRVLKLPPEQEAIRAKCFHPSGSFVEFPKEELDQSVSQRFETIVRMHLHRIAVQTAHQIVTYAEINAMANRLARAILAQRGDKPESVGMLLEKGVEHTGQVNPQKERRWKIEKTQRFTKWS